MLPWGGRYRINVERTVIQSDGLRPDGGAGSPFDGSKRQADESTNRGKLDEADVADSYVSRRPFILT
jgi:hypothetical protein